MKFVENIKKKEDIQTESEQLLEDIDKMQEATKGLNMNNSNDLITFLDRIERALNKVDEKKKDSE